MLRSWQLGATSEPSSDSRFLGACFGRLLCILRGVFHFLQRLLLQLNVVVVEFQHTVVADPLVPVFAPASYKTLQNTSATMGKFFVEK